MTTRPRIATLSLLALLTAGCNAQSHTEAATPTRTQTRTPSHSPSTAAAHTAAGTQTRTVPDPQWGIPGATVTIPAGWKFDGLMSHGETCVSTLPGLRFAVESPDGNIGLQTYLQVRYQYSNDQRQNQQSLQAGCLVTPFFKPEDFLMHVVAPALQPGAHAEVHPVPGGPNQAQDRATAQQGDRQSSTAGIAVHTEINSYALSLDFMRGNVKTTQIFAAEFRCTYSNFALMHLQSAECFINNALAVRAPTAQIEAVVASRVIHAALTPEWDARSTQFIQQRFAVQNANQTARINNDRQNQIARNNALMAHQQAQYEAGMQRAQASSDARHAGDVAFSNHLADENTYRDPSTGNTYQVSNQYSHTYLDSTGRTILQTNSAYAPGPDTVWQELQPHN